MVVGTDKQQFIDRFTRIDELLDKSCRAIHRMLPVLEHIAAGDAVVNIPKEFVDAAKHTEKLNFSVGRLCDLLTKNMHATTGEPSPTFGNISENRITMNYPASGRKTLPIGVTKINIKSRQVFLADSTEEKMYSPREINVVRSMLMYTDCSVDIQLFRDGTPVQISTRFPIWSRINEAFDEIWITTTKNTSFHMQVSDEVDGVPHVVQADYYEGNPFVSNTNVAVAGTPNTEEVYAALSRNGRKGSLRHRGKTGILYVKLSHDGITFTDSIPLEPGDVLEFDGDDLHTIIVDTDIGGTEYILIIQPRV